MKATANQALHTWLLSLLYGLFSATGFAGSLPLPPAGEDVVGETRQIKARYEDTLSDIARRYDLGYEEIVAANPGVDPWLPGEGTAITLPLRYILPSEPREGIIINLAELRLYYFPPGENRVVTHPIGIGREGWSTPTGSWQVVEKINDPSWRPPASIREEHAAKGETLPEVVPPGPDNPLGRFALRLSERSYLLHGTNQPWGVGMRVSHGCIRLYPEDIETLFPHVAQGTPVRILNEPYKAGWLGDKLYLEAHPPLSEQLALNGKNFTPLIKAIVDASDETRQIQLDWAQVRAIAQEQTGIPTFLDGTLEATARAKQTKRPLLLRFSRRPSL